jgi:hypothetical protein
MEGIWIRSQDRKSLVFAKRIMVAKEACAGEMPWKIINEVSFINDTDDYDVLGRYSTEELCTQELDQIQKFIKSSTDIKIHIDRSTPIYEMP